MKYSVTFLLLLAIAFNGAGQQPTFEITGVLKGLHNSKVLLGNKPRGYSNAFKIKYFDSCISKKDTFYFTGHVDYPDFYSIEVEGKKGWAVLILDNSKIFISGSVDSVYRSKVTGSNETDIYYDYFSMG